MSKRADYIRVRLVPAHLGNAIEVKVSPEEKDQLLVAAIANQFGEVSSFLRELGVAAAKKHHQRAAREVAGVWFKARVIEWAAEEAGMRVGEWLRTIGMGATGTTQLVPQLNEAITALKEGLLRDDGDQ